MTFYCAKYRTGQGIFWGFGGGLAAGTFSLIAKICVINGEKYRAHAGVSEYEQSGLNQNKNISSNRAV